MERSVGFIMVLMVLVVLFSGLTDSWVHYNSYMAKKRTDLQQRCPNVGEMRNFNLQEMMGFWHVVQYYASTEELPEYACMRSHFTFTAEDQHITMNFTYIFAEDPLREKQQGNITWKIPEFNSPAHWVHTEDIYEGIYNTYVLDTDYGLWGLIMHCAEKKQHPSYLSALLLSRQPTLPDNVVSFLRDKLQQFNIDLSFMFPINQTSCDNLMESSNDDPLAYIVNGGGNQRNTNDMIQVVNTL